MYASGLGASRGTKLLMRQAYMVTRTSERLAVARRMYEMRFPDEATTGLTMQQLRGREGARVRKIYRQEADRTGVPWTRREYKHGDPNAAGDDVNRLLSMANSVLYGICHAVITGIGASPALGFVHTGSAVSFVLDIADLYKADYTIPLAFDLAAANLKTERDARIGLRERAVEGKLMPRIVHDIKVLLAPEEPDLIDRELVALWDDADGEITGGINWGEDVLDEERYLAVIGPLTDVAESNPPS
jgi:CRISPR-associated protein Cas1